MPQRVMWGDENEKLFWNVERLWELAKTLPVRQVPLQEFAGVFDSKMWFGPQGITFREFVDWMRAVQEADLSYPIILAAEGWIMDGRTRLQQALLQGLHEIATVRFLETPDPDKRYSRNRNPTAGFCGARKTGANRTVAFDSKKESGSLIIWFSHREGWPSKRGHDRGPGAFP